MHFSHTKHVHQTEVKQGIQKESSIHIQILHKLTFTATAMY